MYIVLLLPAAEEVQQRPLSCPPLCCYFFLGPLSTWACRSLDLCSNWLLAYLLAYVTPALQFLTRTLELGAHHLGARLSSISCEPWEPVAITFNQKGNPTITVCATRNCEPTPSTSCIVNIAHCMLSNHPNCHLK